LGGKTGRGTEQIKNSTAKQCTNDKEMEKNETEKCSRKVKRNRKMQREKNII
jgi:hypothetical protein